MPARRPPPSHDPEPAAASAPGHVRLAPGLFLPADALRFSAARSSGPGGQNVNKRSTKVELRVFLADLAAAGMTRAAIARLARAASHLIVKGPSADAPAPPASDQRAAPSALGGELVIAMQETRSQGRNREACIERLIELVQQSLTPPKPRRPTKPGKGAIERRIQAKKETGQRKQRRQWRAGD